MKLFGAPCYQHDSYHSDCSDCYHPNEMDQETLNLWFARINQAAREMCGYVPETKQDVDAEMLKRENRRIVQWLATLAKPPLLAEYNVVFGTKREK